MIYSKAQLKYLLTGYKTLEGGFRMVITNPRGILVTQDGVVREVTPNTVFFYSWFILKNIRRNKNDCPGVIRAKTRAARSLISQLLVGIQNVWYT